MASLPIDEHVHREERSSAGIHGALRRGKDDRAAGHARLIGSHWSTAPLASLTTAERRRLVNYRYGTFGFEQYCDQLVARRGSTTEELYNLRRVLDRWHAAFRDLRTWQYSENVERTGDALNPVGKVMKYEEASISTVRSQLTD